MMRRSNEEFTAHTACLGHLQLSEDVSFMRLCKARSSPVAVMSGLKRTMPDHDSPSYGKASVAPEYIICMLGTVDVGSNSGALRLV